MPPDNGPRVALVEKRGKFFTGTPFFERGPRISLERDRRLRAGALILVRPARGRSKLIRSLGRPEVARDVLEALLLDRGLRRGFAPSVEAEAAEASPVEGPREDLRDVPTFTIDPVSARDFDDAVSAEWLDEAAGRWRVLVHIADVSAYVRPESLLDREARRRGTSVYIPGSVEPMLPHALSSGACSLVPGEDRLAVTVTLEGVGAEVTKTAFARTRIRSDERLTYEDVDAIFAGSAPWSEPWAAPLRVARAVAGWMDEARAQRGALAVESSEPEFSFGDDGEVLEATPVAQTESHRLIEHLMIAANEAVARLLSGRRVPALYRVHEKPSPERVEVLLEQLASLDVPTPPAPDSMSPQQAADVVGEVSALVDGFVRSQDGQGRAALTSLVLRSLRQAAYAPKNLGHAGLQSTAYCHFTSPIRRYPDLVCHRALLSAIGGGEEAPAASGLQDLAVWCSAREREAMVLERDADDVARCFLLERALFEEGWQREFDGEVVGLATPGAFVAFGPRLEFEGLLPMRRLRGDWWELNPEGTVLRGSDSGRTLRLGDQLRVAVGRIDAPRGRVDLHPIEL